MQDLNDLFYFAKVVEHGSYAAAARALGMPKSRLSRRVIELEERLGTALLRRHDRGVTPTAAGEALMTHLVGLFDLLDRIGADMDAFAAGERGHVRLHANMSAVSGFLPEALAGLTFSSFNNRKSQHIWRNRSSAFNATIRLRATPCAPTDSSTSLRLASMTC